MHSKASAALMRLKEIDRKYKFRQNESRRHLSDVSSDSAFENTSSMKNCVAGASNTKIKLEIQIPNISRVEPEIGNWKMKGSLASATQNPNDDMRENYSRTSSTVICSDILAPPSPIALPKIWDSSIVADVRNENGNNETSTSETIRTIDERSGTISELSQNSETLAIEELKTRGTESSVKNVYSNADNLDSRLQDVHEAYNNDTFDNESSTTLMSGKRSKSFENPSVSNSIEEEKNDVRESDDDSIKQVEITPRNSPTRRSDDGRVDEVVVELVAPKLLQSTSECEVGLDKELSNYVKILEMRDDKELIPVQLLKPPKHRGITFSARRVKQRKTPAANMRSPKDQQEMNNKNVTAVQSFDVFVARKRFSADDSDPREQQGKARENSIAKNANNKHVQEKEARKENDDDNNEEEEERRLNEKRGNASLNIVLNPSWDYELHYDDDVESVVTERDADLLKEENKDNQDKQTREEEEEKYSLVKVTGLKEVKQANKTEDEKKDKDEGQERKQKLRKYVEVVGGGGETVEESNCTESSLRRHENATMLLRKLHYDVITAIDNRYASFERRVRAEKIAWKKSIAKDKERENEFVQRKDSRTSERQNHAHQRAMKRTRKACIIHQPQLSSPPIRDHHEYSEFVEENERMNVLKRRLNALRLQQERENLRDRIYQFEGTRLGLRSLAISGKLKPALFAPLEFPKIVNFTRNETVDARRRSFASSRTALSERIISIRQWIKDQYFLYRDYSDLARRINSNYVPASLEEAKKTIRQLHETTIKTR